MTKHTPWTGEDKAMNKDWVEAHCVPGVEIWMSGLWLKNTGS